MKIGIVSFGAYVPRYRIKAAEIAQVWRKDVKEIVGSLRVAEKSVPDFDEDTITMGVAAAENALEKNKITRTNIGAVYVGSESHPYAVKPSSVTVAEALGMGGQYFAADLQFACKAGTAALQIVSALLAAKKIEYGLALGADAAQGRPGDALEYTAAAGAAAFILGRNPEEIILEIKDYLSVSSDTPDFWRGKHEKYPSHAERFTGEPAYFKHVVQAARTMMKKKRLKPVDFKRVVFHMPNGKFPRLAAKILGFSEKQIQDSLIVEEIGNTYAASSLLGLARTLEKSKPGEKILLVSYGSGSGSDVFLFEVTQNIKKLNKAGNRVGDSLEDQLKRKSYLTYGEYARRVGKIS